MCKLAIKPLTIICAAFICISRPDQLDLVLSNVKELIGGVKVGGCLRCSDHQLEFSILRGSRAKSRSTTLDFRRANLSHFRDLLGRIPWDMTVERRGVGWYWSPPSSSRKLVLRSRKTNRSDRRSAWMNKKIPTELRHTEKVVYEG